MAVIFFRAAPPVGRGARGASVAAHNQHRRLVVRPQLVLRPVRHDRERAV